MTPLRDEFLSEEDLDLRNLSEEELIAYWNQWLELAQQTNDADAHSYSHGVFESEPPLGLRSARQRPAEGRSSLRDPRPRT